MKRQEWLIKEREQLIEVSAGIWSELTPLLQEYDNQEHILLYEKINIFLWYLTDIWDFVSNFVLRFVFHSQRLHFRSYPGSYDFLLLFSNLYAFSLSLSALRRWFCWRGLSGGSPYMFFSSAMPIFGACGAKVLRFIFISFSQALYPFIPVHLWYLFLRLERENDGCQGLAKLSWDLAFLMFCMWFL